MIPQQLLRNNFCQNASVLKVFRHKEVCFLSFWSYDISLCHFFFLDKLGTSSQEKNAMVSITVALLFWSSDFSWMY